MMEENRGLPGLELANRLSMGKPRKYPELLDSPSR
jgi:hypothetical protein